MSKSIIRKVLSGKYSFPKSKNDIEMLRKLLKDEKVEKLEPFIGNNYDWRYYTSVFNICSEFGEQVLDTIDLLNQFNNHVVDMEEAHMPSYPPMSPVTNSYFTSWLTLDAPVKNELTLGLLFSRYTAKKKTMLYTQKAMNIMNSSYASFYQVVGGNLEKTILWDIVGKTEIEACCTIKDISKAEYAPLIGDVWYARILPSIRGTDFPHVVFCTPYVFRETRRKQWEEFFARRRVNQAEESNAMINYLKRGDSFGYWLEFIFQTYVGHTSEVIFSEGVPDIQESRPHGKYGSLSKV